MGYRGGGGAIGFASRRGLAAVRAADRSCQERSCQESGVTQTKGKWDGLGSRNNCYWELKQEGLATARLSRQTEVSGSWGGAGRQQQQSAGAWTVGGSTPATAVQVTLATSFEFGHEEQQSTSLSGTEGWSRCEDGSGPSTRGKVRAEGKAEDEAENHEAE